MGATRIDACRSCGSTALSSVLDLGSMPLSDGLRRREQLGKDEARYPLEVAFCGGCAYVQILHDVEPEELFGDDYPYFSSFSDHLLDHSRANVERILAERGLGEDSLVVELASNDGYLLQYFCDAGIPVLGIDPAKQPVEAARERGVDTLHAFFSRELGEQLQREGCAADVVIGNNVLAHVPDPNGFVAGIAALLKPDGTTSIEAPYVRELVENCQFDTIYHEHLGYWSVTAAKALFERNGLHLNRVTPLDIHGGSLRYEASPTRAPDPSIEELLEAEREVGVDGLTFFEDFGRRVGALTERLRETVTVLRQQGRRVAAYGAAAKGAILLNAVGIDGEILDFVVDRNVHKQGLFMPGVDIEILPPEALIERRPDDVLLLPWNFEDEIVSQQLDYLRAGGRFLIPVPEPRFVTIDEVKRG